jgi:probable HAF family extracellular repeat protein
MQGFTKYRRALVCLVSVSISLGLLSGVGTRRAKAQLGGATYSVTDLGSLGGLQSKARAINNAGRVVGQSSLPSSVNSFPFAWDGASMLNMESFTGGSSGDAQALNEFGYAVGSAETSAGNVHPFIWSDIFGKRDLGTLGGDFAVAFDINDGVQVVGQSEIQALVDRGFVWSPATGMQAIPTLGGASSAAYGINNLGQIVGGSSTSNGAFHAYLLSGGVMNDIGTLGGSHSVAYEINDVGQAVGGSTLLTGPINPPHHAFIYTVSGGMTSLGTLGGNRSVAYDINSNGDVVGSSEIAAGVERAFLYTALSGMQNLNTLIGSTGWTLLEARGINNRGEIVGTGINPQGRTHAFLLKSLRDEIPEGEPPPCFSTSSPILIPAQPSLAPLMNTKDRKRTLFKPEMSDPERLVPLRDFFNGANRVTRNQKLLIGRDNVDGQP